MTTMAYCVDSVEEGGREGVFSPCWWFIGTKKAAAEGDGGGLEEAVPMLVESGAPKETRRQGTKGVVADKAEYGKHDAEESEEEEL